MPNLIIMKDQAGATGKDIIPLPDGFTATGALMRYFPDGINPEITQVFIGLRRMNLPNEDGQTSPEIFEPLTENITVVSEVKGVDPFTIFIAFAALLAVTTLTPKIPNDLGITKQSPNNSLQAQTNIARPYQAYPLIFGSPVSYPDLAGEAVKEYYREKPLITQLMVIGRDKFELQNGTIGLRAGTTPLTNFNGASAEYYEPDEFGVTIVDEEISYFSTNEIDGQELLGTDNEEVIKTYLLEAYGSGTASRVGSTFTMKLDKNFGSDDMKSDYLVKPSDFKVQLRYQGGDAWVPDGLEYIGAGLISSMELSVSGDFYTLILSEWGGQTPQPSGNYNFDNPFEVFQAENSILGPIKLGVECEEFWIDFNFPRGLKSKVELAVTEQKLDAPFGNPIPGTDSVANISFEADTLDQLNRTLKHDTNSGFGYYQVTVERLDVGTSSAENPDQCTIEAIAAIVRRRDVARDNLTMVKVVIPATVNASSTRENKINLTPTSMLITYENGAINYTARPSRYFADAILHLTVISFDYQPEILALDELFEIQDRLIAIDPRLAYFDFTFDDIDISYGEMLDTILDVARCYKWDDGGVYRFARNEKQSHEATVITRRDLASDREYLLSYNPQLLESYDSVKVQYVNKETNAKAYIYRKIDDNGDVIDGSGVNPKSLELAGCYEEYNAINRAELEIRELMYRRFTLTDTLESSGMFLDRGNMVLYAEQYNTNVFNGEILEVDGNIAITSEKQEFIDGVDYVVNYSTSDGSSVGPFAVTGIDGNPFMFRCESLSDVFVRDSELGFKIQTGSRYVISTVEELQQSRWTVMEKEPRGKNVQLTFVSYDDRIYEFDEE